MGPGTNVRPQRLRRQTVGEEGLEPSRSFEHELLKLERLPISSLARFLA